MHNPDGGPQVPPPNYTGEVQGQPITPAQAPPGPPVYGQAMEPMQPNYAAAPLPSATAGRDPYANYETPGPGGISRQTMIVGGVIGAVVLIACIALAFAGQLGSFLTIGVIFIPLAALAAFAYGGTRNVAAALFAYAMLAVIMLGLFLNSLTYILFGFVADWDAFNRLLSSPGALDSSTLTGMFSPNAGGGLLFGLLLLFLAVLLSASMLFKGVRVALSRIMPIDPDNFVHKIALPVLAMILFSSFIPLIVLGGVPPLLTFVSGAGNSGATSNALATGPEDLIYQFVWTIPVALIAAGWPIARRMRTALERLGFVRPTIQQVAFGIGFGVVLAFLAIYALDPGINWLWRTLGLPTTDVAAFEKLLSNLITPLGAILIGVTAGVGEEMAVRGLLQPRIGLIASNLVFTSLHAFQYGLDGLLSVFLIGLILGIIRARTNTTTSAIVHGVYDFVLVIFSVVLAGQ